MHKAGHIHVSLLYHFIYLEIQDGNTFTMSHKIVSWFGLEDVHQLNLHNTIFQFS